MTGFASQYFDGIVYSMTGEIGPPISPEDLSRAYVENNSRRIDEIIAQESSVWQEAIDAGDGFSPYHEAQLALLAGLGDRVKTLARLYRVEEQVDREFFYDLLGFIRATDYDPSDPNSIPPTRKIETEHIVEAVLSLRERNAGLQEAA